jgi:transcriptional regulator with PAS, ATPase and Fis domain
MKKGIAFMRNLLTDWLNQVNELPIGIIGLEERGNVFYMNRIACSLLRIHPRLALGKPVRSASPEYPIKEIFQTGKSKNSIACLFGDHRFKVSLVPVTIKGRVIAAIGFMDGYAETIAVSRGHPEHKSGRHSKRVAYEEFTFENIIGDSKAIISVKNEAIRAAQSQSTILLLGETGTGKDLFAHAIHKMSKRKEGPFIQVNCAGIPENLMESELFGYEEGSFSGARKGGKPGKFELAHGGTLFLDEVGDMSLAMQAKLLRILQDHRVERLGGTRSMEVDIRVIAATNKDIGRLVRSALFREDLYYRLDVFSIRIPPLRERLEDIPLLAEYFIPLIQRYTNSGVTQVSGEVLRLFQCYSWPGNVRELQNVIEAAMNRCTGTTITLQDLSQRLKKELSSAYRMSHDSALSDTGDRSLKELERGIIVRALEVNEGNKRQAARDLGIPRSSLYNKIRRYQISL